MVTLEAKSPSKLKDSSNYNNKHKMNYGLGSERITIHAPPSFEHSDVSTKKYLLPVPYLHQLQQFSSINEPQLSFPMYSNTRIKYCQQCLCAHVGYDHHCVWMSACIHATNYMFFMWFIVAAWVLLILMVVVSVVAVVGSADELSDLRGADLGVWRLLVFLIV